MPIPDVDIPINTIRFPMDWIRKAERAVERVHVLLLQTAQTLEKAGIPYAVIGGNAVAIWVASRDAGAIRNTKDVDILLNRADLERAAQAMSEAGFDMTEVNGETVFLDRRDPMPSRGVHVVFAGERIFPHDTLPAPSVKPDITSPEGTRALDLHEPPVLKLLAFRRIDQVHIADMYKVGLIDDSVAEKIPSELRPRLEEIRANPDG